MSEVRSFLSLFLGLVTALSFDSGQRAIIQLADKMLDSLSIEQVSGGLQDGLVLENLRFQQPA